MAEHPVAAGAAPRPTTSTRARAIATAASRWVGGASDFERWIVLGLVVGAIAGVGAIVFYDALQAATHLLLGGLAGYHPPNPVGEGGAGPSGPPARPWALPLVVGGGAAVGAVLVFWLAPEAEGHGTDAAISAVHHNPRGVRFRAVLVKIVASALTIGAGGSGGREGPTGQISAGFGSLLTRVLELDPATGRILVSTGIGSGIGAIFGAPLGGAVLAAEILYRDDFDPSALLPCFVASGISWLVFGAAEGYHPLFGSHAGYVFNGPTQLGFFALIGILGGLVGLLYAKGFYGMVDLTHRSPLPRWVNPALAGLAVGAIGLAVPQVLGTGYGWVQQALGPQLMTMPLWIVLAVPFLRIAATALSIGTGGSGGIFGPGMVIGAFLGASVWRLFEPIVPAMGHDPAPYVIVGMMCCFGSIARAPVAVMLMVAEMTGSLSLLAPAMVAVGLAWLIVRRNDDTIYRSQLRTRADAPGAALRSGLPLLASLPVARAAVAPRLVLDGAADVARARAALEGAGVPGAPVVDDAGRFEGVVDTADLQGPEVEDDQAVDRRADAGASTMPTDGPLDVALEALAQGGRSWVTVVDGDRRVVGTLALSDVVAAYRSTLATDAERLGSWGPDAGVGQLAVAADRPGAGGTLRDLGLPHDVVVTSVRRGERVIVPTGATTIEPGDRLFLVGPPERLAALDGVTGPDGQANNSRP